MWGSQPWRASMHSAARPAAPGRPPPPSRSRGGAQGRLGQGLPRGSVASALMNTSQGASALRGWVVLGQGLPSPHTCTLQSHLEGTPRTMSPSPAQPATLLLGCGPECVFKTPGVSLWGHFQVLGKPEVSCLQLPPRGDAHTAHTLNSRSPGHLCPTELQRWKCPVFTLPEILTSHYPQEAMEQLKGGYVTEEGNFKFYPKFLGFTLNHPVEAGGHEMRSESAESSPGH